LRQLDDPVPSAFVGDCVIANIWLGIFHEINSTTLSRSGKIGAQLRVSMNAQVELPLARDKAKLSRTKFGNFLGTSGRWKLLNRNMH